MRGTVMGIIEIENTCLRKRLKDIKEAFKDIELLMGEVNGEIRIPKDEFKNLKEAIEAETKQKAVVKAFTGYTDTAVIAGKLHNTECMSYGPGSLQYAHKPDEFVEIRDIIRCEKVINYLVMSLCGER